LICGGKPPFDSKADLSPGGESGYRRSGFFELDQRRLSLVSAQQLFPTHQRSKLRTFVAARKLNLFH
jgi:hypothetical protein